MCFPLGFLLSGVCVDVRRDYPEMIVSPITHQFCRLGWLIGFTLVGGCSCEVSAGEEHPLVVGCKIRQENTPSKLNQKKRKGNVVEKEIKIIMTL